MPTAQKALSLRAAWRGYVWAFAAAAAATLLAAPFASHLDLANIVMLYMLAVVAIAFRFGKGAAAASTVINVSAFDFFFVPPRFSFAVADAQYLLTFAVMLVTGLVIARLAASLRHQAADALRRERQSHDLYEMARLLSGAIADEQIVDASAQFFARSFNATASLMVRDQAGSVSLSTTLPVALKSVDITVAQQVFDGESTVPVVAAGRLIYVALKAPMRTRGVLIIAPNDPNVLEDVDQRRQLETVAVLIAIALERVHFVKVAGDATVLMEGERLRSGLLAALSHDLRTPLTAILGSAESLQLGAPRLTRDQSALIDAICDQARRTNALVENILDMARLESGAVRLHKEWQSLEEIVGSAIKARATTLVGHPVDVALPADLPLVECDAILIERVFVNLLENAAKYTPPGSAIRIGAIVDAGTLRIDVTDSGAGVPSGQEIAIFGKFVRANPVAGVPGLGLGLAICRTIVEAHRGRIWVENAAGAGAVFAFTLPQGQPPAFEPESLEAP